jgi:hypothetical protein
MSDRPRNRDSIQTCGASPNDDVRREFSIIRARVRAIRTLSILFALALSNAACFPLQVPDWKPFGSSNEGFHVLFPTAPETAKNTVPAGSESFELRSYVSEVGPTSLYVGVCDYGARGRTADPVTLLDGAKRGAVEHLNAHFLTEKKIELDSNPGVAFDAESDKLHFTVRMVLSDGLLYQMMVVSPLNQNYADTDRFLDSFRLIARPPAPATAAGSPDWNPYSYEADGFSASFPAPPNVEKQNISTDAGQFELRTYSTQDSSAALTAAVCDYGSTVEGKDPDDVLESSESGALENLKAHLIAVRKINLGVEHGVEFEAENESEHISARMYLRGSSLYQFLIVCPVNTKYGDTARFFDSIHFREKTGK